MTNQAISSTGPAQAANPFASMDTGKFGDMSSEEFINVLITEMTNQDPFQPNDSAAVMEQLSSLRNIESQVALQESIELLVTQNNIAQAGSMIGKTVEGLTQNNNTISGTVTAVRVVDGQAQLELDGLQTITLDRVTAIHGNGGA